MVYPTGAYEGIITLKFRVTLEAVTQVRWGEDAHTSYFHG